MAERLAHEELADRELQRRIRDGEIHSTGISPSTVRNWVRDWTNGGLIDLIDGRHLRPFSSWDLIDTRYREAAKNVIDSLVGDRSTVSLNELDRRTRVALRADGYTDVATPQRITQEFLSALKSEKGSTTRSQRSRALRKASGTRHYPAIRPGQVVAIDATRADSLVYDSFTGDAVSVEILTAIDVATRVVVALRVVPKSANGIDAGLLLYDVCRPFSLVVEGTSVSDWRWVGLPAQVDMTAVNVWAGRRLVAPDFSTLQGQHHIPSVLPDAVRCDHGSIFVSDHFRVLLRDLGIDLLLSRGKKPTDNPHVERWHETLQRAVQQIPGYKGRNP
jgi:transposase InsO family protein